VAVGRREHNKIEKRRRIKDAARDVFRERGFEAATTREIVTASGVSSATLFSYVRNKRDLLLLVFNDDLDALSAAALDPIDDDAPLLDQLMAFFRPRYEFWARDPRLSRAAVEIIASTRLRGPHAEPGSEAHRFDARGPVTVAQIAGLVAAKQRRGDVRSPEDATTIAGVFMELFQAEQRAWLSHDAPTVANGLDRLRRLFAIVITGVAPGALPEPP
jgi:AcrR family transcriptional regulator